MKPKLNRIIHPSLLTDPCAVVLSKAVTNERHLLVTDSDEEQYDADNAQDHYDYSTENAFIRGVTVGVDDYVTFGIVVAVG